MAEVSGSMLANLSFTQINNNNNTSNGHREHIEGKGVVVPQTS